MPKHPRLRYHPSKICQLPSPAYSVAALQVPVVQALMQAVLVPVVLVLAVLELGLPIPVVLVPALVVRVAMWVVRAAMRVVRAAAPAAKALVKAQVLVRPAGLREVRVLAVLQAPAALRVPVIPRALATLVTPQVSLPSISKPLNQAD